MFLEWVESQKKVTLITKFIDYPFSNLNSEMMDLYLIKNCYFYR